MVQFRPAKVTWIQPISAQLKEKRIVSMNEDTTLDEFILEHCSESMQRALEAERYPLWKRNCPEMSDIDFIYFGLLRSISTVDSGRHFLQLTEEVYGEPIAMSTYFKSLKSLKSLKSSRRRDMLTVIEKHSYSTHCARLASSGVDYLKQFSELDQYTVEAADGHFIDHAYHTEKGTNGKAYAAGFIYSMDLRYGLLKPLCCITNGTKRSHEIPVLRNHIEEQNRDSLQSLQKQLYVYDKAATDYAWWDKQKSHENYMVSVLKENSVANFVESISFDKNSAINTGVESYSIYENRVVKFSVVNYRDPETEQLHRFIATLPTSINPGTIAMIYYKRWTIEKAFNNSKSNLKEKKAWSSNSRALNNQIRLTAMSYNIIRVFEEISKVENPNLVHPSDEKYTKALEKRDEDAKAKSRFVSPLLFQKRIARISSYTIRAVQNALLTAGSLLKLMETLAGRLVPRSCLIGAH